VAFLFLFLYFVSYPSTGKASNSTSVDIFPPNSEPYGLSYEQHIQNFWKWLLALPKDRSPFEDSTGEYCAIGQEKSNSTVFYLAGNGGGASDRTCIVPAGKGLLIPVMVVEIAQSEYPGATVEDLSSIAKKDQDSVYHMSLTIDGKEYNFEDLVKYRKTTGPFEVVFPDKNLAVMSIEKGGPTVAAADGHYILTEPLPKGNHTIQWVSNLLCTDPDCADPNFGQDIGYKITAQ
jgi:hypothetical protein